MRTSLHAAAIVLLLAGCVTVPSRQVPVFSETVPFVGPPRIEVRSDAIRVPAGADVIELVVHAPPGATFVFETGVHRLERPIVPRTGDTFIGEPGAVLSGALSVEADGREGDLWFVADLPLDLSTHGNCRRDRPRCNVRHDLFLDDVALQHVPTVHDVITGTWTFDADAGRVYLADDPSERRLEVSVAMGAIVGAADDVTVAYLTIERFANPAQRGAVMAERVGSPTVFGQRWTIVGNEVRWNHGVGIRAGGGSWIVTNHVHHNGQLGIASVGPGPTRVEANEIAFNNVAGYADTWEAGGTKFVRTDGLLVRHNHVHHNDGPGLWTDIDNVRTVVEHNLVEHNASTGIFHEISFDAVIRGNEVRYNGLAIGLERYAYVFGAGILIANSQNTTVYANRVVGNWNGILGLHQDRGSGALGAYVLRNVTVFDNTVWMPYHADGIGPTGQRGVTSMSGVAQSGGFDEVFGAAYGNRFFDNRYVVADPQRRHFRWNNATLTFSAWQRCGSSSGASDSCRQDAEGSLLQDPAVQDLPRR